MKKLLLILTMGLMFTGCAGISKLHGEYNPENLPSKELASIGEASSFGERFWSQTFYRIIGVNNKPPPKYFDGISKVAAGHHIVDWVRYEIVDLGYAQAEEIRAQGKMVINIESGVKYAIGIMKEGDGSVQLWNRETLEIVSKPCTSDCQLLKQALFGIDGKDFVPKLPRPKTSK